MDRLRRETWVRRPVPNPPLPPPAERHEYRLFALPSNAKYILPSPIYHVYTIYNHIHTSQLSAAVCEHGPANRTSPRSAQACLRKTPATRPRSRRARPFPLPQGACSYPTARSAKQPASRLPKEMCLDCVQECCQSAAQNYLRERVSDATCDWMSAGGHLQQEPVEPPAEVRFRRPCQRHEVLICPCVVTALKHDNHTYLKCNCEKE